VDFSAQKDKIISAAFLDALLTGGCRTAHISHEGLWIQGATIDGSLSLAGADVPYLDSLNQCTFKGDLDLSGSHFHNTLSLNDSKFERRADFSVMQVDGDLAIERAVFQNSFDLNGTSIGGSLVAGGATFLDEGKTGVQLDGVRVHSEINL